MVKLRSALFIAAVAMTLSGCVSGTSTESLRGEWVLTAGKDATGELDTTISDVTLAIGEDGVSGRVCNSYGGTISGSPTDLSVTSLYSTEMYCTTPEGIMELEQRFLADLGAVTGATVDGSQLTLTGDDVTLEFTTAN
jgi:heat shock protein HslJ